MVHHHDGPGTDPFEALEARSLAIAVNPRRRCSSSSATAAAGSCAASAGAWAPTTTRSLLVIDQFEEIFTGSSRDDADEFLDALASRSTEPTSPLRLVVDLRADFYDRPLAHQTLRSVLKRRRST